MSFWGSSKFQMFLSEISSMLGTLHDLVMVWLLVIIIVVITMSVTLMKGPCGLLMANSGTLESVMTILPSLILVTIAYPSIYLLCLQDSFSYFPGVTLKILASQWSWQSASLEEVDHLLDTDKVQNIASLENPILLKRNKVIRFIVTSTDVLHSLGIPNLGIKLDATPGRLNSVMVDPNFLGLLEGSCFELCGSGHSVMPISLLSY